MREDCLKPLDLSVTEGAKRLGVGRQTLSNLVNEKVSVSIEMAYRLSKAFGSTPETWLGMQLAYDLAQSRDLERKINWRLYKEYSCGLMTELASHQIQVANWLKNALPVSVMGTGSINYWKDGREVFDNVALIYSYEDGTQFIYDSMTSNRHYGLEEQILGDEGTLELEVNKRYFENPPPPPEPPPPAGIVQLLKDIESIFSKETLICSMGKLASITIKLPKSNLEQSGVYYFILKQLAWANIPVQEVISTTHEMTLVVKEIDINRTFSILIDLKKSK